MLKSIKNIPLWLSMVFAMGILFLVTDVVYANDTTQVTNEATSTRDTLITNDSIIIIHTVCAPICSSHVRVCNKEWKEIGILKAPFKSAFPEAYIENNQLLWRDNDNFDYEPAP